MRVGKTKAFFFVFFATLVFSGCIDELGKFGYSVSFPESRGQYVGFSDDPAACAPDCSKPAFGSQIVINYEAQPDPQKITISLNGRPIQDFFAFGANQAVASVSEIKQFFTQGQNTLLVDIINFGPVVTFTLDSQGPEVVIDEVEWNRDANEVTVKGLLSDASTVSSLTMQTCEYTANGENDDEGFRSSEIFNCGAISDESAILNRKNFEVTVTQGQAYRFISSDQYGYESVTNYLANGEFINPTFKMRLASSLLDSVESIGEGVLGLHSYSSYALERDIAHGQSNLVADYNRLIADEEAIDSTNMLKSINDYSAFFGRANVLLGIAVGNSIGNEIPGDENRCGQNPTSYSELSRYEPDDYPELTPAELANFWCASPQLITTAESVVGRYELKQEWVCPSNAVDIRDGYSYQDRTSGGQNDPNANYVARLSGSGTCSFVSIYEMRVDEVESLDLGLANDESSKLELDVTMSDSDGDGSAVDLTIGVRDQTCSANRSQTIVTFTQTDTAPNRCGNTGGIGGGGIGGKQCGSDENGVNLGQVWAWESCNMACDRVPSWNSVYGTSAPWVVPNGRVETYPFENGTFDELMETGNAEITPAVCSDSGEVSALGLANMGKVGVTILDGYNLQGAAVAQFNDGQFNLDVNDLDLGLSPSTAEISLDNDFLDFFLNMLSGALSGVFRDIAANVLENNLQEFRLLFNQKTGWDTEFDIYSGAEQTFTQCVVAGEKVALNQCGGSGQSEIDWHLYYKGNVPVLVADDRVTPPLGSRYVENAVAAPSNLEGDADNFAIVINSNVINQALTAFYMTGATHFAILDGKTHFRPDATDDMGKKGDLRIAFVPSGPGYFEMEAGTASTAQLVYRNASMNIEKKQADDSWKADFNVNVDIAAGVEIRAVDNQFEMTVKSDPRLKVNSVVNNTPLPVPQEVLQVFLDVLLKVGVPQLAQTSLELDLPSLSVAESPDGHQLKLDLSTQTVEAANGSHLSFSMGAKICSAVDDNGESEPGFPVCEN